MAEARGSEHAAGATAPAYPFLRVAAIAWLCVYVPAYASTYGAWHFLYLCNLGVLATALGLILSNQLLLSSQALIAPAIALLWILDAGTRLSTGHFLHGGTAYMWDDSLPPLVRALSLYHLAWPLLLAYCLRRNGYDRRAWLLQGALATGAIAIGLFVAPASENIDYVFRSPGAAAPAASPLLHALEILGVLAIAFFWPLHRLCCALFASVVRVAPPTPRVAADASGAGPC